MAEQFLLAEQEAQEAQEAKETKGPKIARANDKVVTPLDCCLCGIRDHEMHPVYTDERILWGNYVYRADGTPSYPKGDVCILCYKVVRQMDGTPTVKKVLKNRELIRTFHTLRANYIAAMQTFKDSPTAPVYRAA